MRKFTIMSCVCLAIVGCWQLGGAQQPASRATATSKIVGSDREQDGLIGPVRRVRFETAKIVIKEGKQSEGSRAVSEITTYDINGRKIDSVAYPVENSAPAGREQYLYDDKGNISEMVVRGLDGSILTKETYSYEFDQLGNWKKMSSSVAVFEDGKLSFEPIEVTYRTITYYYGQAVDKAAAPSPNKLNPASVNSVPLASISNHPSVATATEAKDGSDSKVPVAPIVIVGNGEGNKQPSPANPLAVSTEVPIAANDRNGTREAAVPTMTPAVAPEPSSLIPISIGSKETIKAPPAASATPERLASTIQNISVPSIATPTTNENARPTALAGGPAPTNTKTATPSTNANAQPSKPIESGLASVEPVDHYKQGLAYLQKGKYSAALDAFRQAAVSAPYDALVHMNLGLAYSATLQYKEAANAFKQAIRLNAQVVDAEAYYRLGEAYTALEKNSEAVNAFKQAMYIIRNQAVEPDPTKYNGFPTPDQAHYGLGLAYFNQASYKEAIKEFKQAVELKPGFDEAHYGIALAHIGLADLKSAEKEEKILRPLNGALADKVAATINRSVILPPGVSKGGIAQRQ